MRIDGVVAFPGSTRGSVYAAYVRLAFIGLAGFSCRCCIGGFASTVPSEAYVAEQCRSGLAGRCGYQFGSNDWRLALEQSSGSNRPGDKPQQRRVCQLQLFGSKSTPRRSLAKLCHDRACGDSLGHRLGIWFNRSKRNGPDAYENDAASTAVHLRLDRQALLVFISSLIGFGILATAALLITSWVTRGIQVPYSSFLAVGPAAAGLVILGPWLGPLINPGGGSSTAWQLTSVALPVLVFGVAPFFIWRRPVRIAKAI